jgi:serine/threonine protein kinase
VEVLLIYHLKCWRRREWDFKQIYMELVVFFMKCLWDSPPFFDDNLDKLYENIRTGKLKFPSWISKPARSLISGLLERNVSKRIGAKNM